MYANTENDSILKRRQQQGFLQPLELPSLPPLSQLLTEKQKLEQQKNEKLSMSQAMTEPSVEPTVINPMVTYPSTHVYNPTQIKPDPIGLLQPTFDMPHVNNTASEPIVLSNEFLQQPDMFHLAMTDSSFLQERPSSVTSTEDKYAFVPLPASTHRKRPRRRYDEIERLYHCIWPGCTKAYGTLNHLNAHVSMQQHGPKRHPSEFKEMRKEWRRQKKAREAAKKSEEQNNVLQSTFPSSFIPNNMTFGHFY